MGDLVLIEGARAERDKVLWNDREHMASCFEILAAKARAGEIIAACIATVPSDRGFISVNAVKTADCGGHELVGASAILATYIANVVSQ